VVLVKVNFTAAGISEVLKQHLEQILKKFFRKSAFDLLMLFEFLVRCSVSVVQKSPKKYDDALLWARGKKVVYL